MLSQWCDLPVRQRGFGNLLLEPVHLGHRLGDAPGQIVARRVSQQLLPLGDQRRYVEGRREQNEDGKRQRLRREHWAIAMFLMT